MHFTLAFEEGLPSFPSIAISLILCYEKRAFLLGIKKVLSAATSLTIPERVLSDFSGECGAPPFLEQFISLFNLFLILLSHAEIFGIL